MATNKKGFTLIEALVVLTVLTVLVLSVYIVFKSGMDAWSKSNTRLDIFQNARVVLDQMSREISGALVGGGAEFNGVDGGAGSDSVEFVTDFAGDIYKLKYEIAATNILQRRYIENPADYTDTSYTTIAFSDMVSDIQLSYLPSGSTAADAWSTDAEDGWDFSVKGVLPEAVKITLTFIDSETRTYPFETKVYLPNSE